MKKKDPPKMGMSMKKTVVPKVPYKGSSSSQTPSWKQSMDNKVSPPMQMNKTVTKKPLPTMQMNKTVTKKKY